MRRFLFALTFLYSHALSAQPYIDIFSGRTYLMPAAIGDSTTKEHANLWATIGADLPFKLDDDVILVSPFFEMYELSSNTELTGYALPVSYVKQWSSSRWKTAFTFIPRINYSEFFSKNSSQFGGAVLAIYKKKDNLKYKVGAYYNSEFFGFFMLPLLGIDWNVSDKLNLFGVLPGSMNLEYKMWRRVYTGLVFRSITSSYRAFDKYDYYKIQDNHLRLFFDFYLTKNLVLTAETGHSILRKYSYGVRSDNVKMESDLKYKDGLISKVALSWRIRLDEKGVQ